MRWRRRTVKFSDQRQSRWSSKHETSLQSTWSRKCSDSSVEDHFWHIIVFWISSDNRRCQICIWTFMSKEYVIDSFFQFTKKCFFFNSKNFFWAIIWNFWKNQCLSICLQYRDSTSKSSLFSFEICDFFWFERFKSIENAAWNDLNVSIVINAIEYVCFRDLIFMIIASANIIIDCLLRFDLMNDCDCDSFSILEFKIDASWTSWFSIWFEFIISFIFKSIWKKNIVSIIFSLNFWSRSEIISKIKE